MKACLVAVLFASLLSVCVSFDFEVDKNTPWDGMHCDELEKQYLMF